MQPSSIYLRSAAAVHPVSYVYDMSRLASVGFHATLWFTHPRCARLARGAIPLPPTHIVVSLSVASCMSRKPIWYLSDRPSYCEYCCTATVHEIEDVVEHQLTHRICLPYICPSLLSRRPLRSDRRGLFHHKTFTPRSGRNLSTEKSSLALHSGCGWAQPSFCVRPA